jgi:lipoprotein-anchoring transpeptidase ErfK/SrfK
VPRLLAAAALAAGVSGGTLGALAACSEQPVAGGAAGSSPDSRLGSTLADPKPPAFTAPAPIPLQTPRYESTWATVRLATAVRAAPRRPARVVAHLDRTTPEGTTNVVHTRGRAKDSRGTLWIQVRVPGRRDSVTGWVPSGSVPPPRPPPTGEFYVRNMLTRYRSVFYGPIAFGTSARSPTLTDWPAGGFVGIHGTNRPDLIPGAVSHGCIRLRNEDIVRLARLMPVGTSLTIRA